MSYGVLFSNGIGNTVMSSDYLQPYFYGKISGSLTIYEVKDLNLGISDTEAMPMVFVTAPALNATVDPTLKTVINTTTTGASLSGLSKSGGFWHAELIAPQHSSTTYEIYMFVQRPYVVGAGAYGLTLYSQTGQITYSTADAKKPAAIGVMPFVANYDIPGMPPVRTILCQEIADITGMTKPAVMSVSPVPARALGGTRFDDDTGWGEYVHASFMKDSTTDKLHIVTVIRGGFTGFLNSLTATWQDSFIPVIDGAYYD